jgi:hypothetical protein
MSTALTITVDEINGRLKFSRSIFLGSEYDITWAGLAAGAPNPTLSLFDCYGNALCVSVAATGSLKLNTLELIALWENMSRNSKAVHAYAYEDSVILGTSVIPLTWSPLSFEVGPSPVSIIGIKDLLEAHILDSTIHVGTGTLAQIGGATAVHQHNATDGLFILQDNILYQMKFAHVGGQLTSYYEAITP